jgi:hypothetical protein
VQAHTFFSSSSASSGTIQITVEALLALTRAKSMGRVEQPCKEGNAKKT